MWPLLQPCCYVQYLVIHPGRTHCAPQSGSIVTIPHLFLAQHFQGDATRGAGMSVLGSESYIISLMSFSPCCVQGHEDRYKLGYTQYATASRKLLFWVSLASNFLSNFSGDAQLQSHTGRRGAKYQILQNHILIVQRRSMRPFFLERLSRLFFFHVASITDYSQDIQQKRCSSGLQAPVMVRPWKAPHTKTKNPAVQRGGECYKA